MNNDYISRQDAKDALQEKVFHNLTDEFYGAMQVLTELHAADVVPVVHGKWIHDGHHRRCNRCGTYFCNTDREGDTIPDNFCPNCGAKMCKE